MDLDLLITSMADAVVESNRREVAEAVPPGSCVEYVGELSEYSIFRVGEDQFRSIPVEGGYVSFCHRDEAGKAAPGVKRRAALYAIEAVGQPRMQEALQVRLAQRRDDLEAACLSFALQLVSAGGWDVGENPRIDLSGGIGAVLRSKNGRAIFWFRCSYHDHG